MNPANLDGGFWCPEAKTAQAESLLGPCLARPVWAGPLRSQDGGRCLGSALPPGGAPASGGGGESRGAPPRERRCGIQSLRALDTPPRFHDLLKPEFMASDSIGLPTPICLLGPCTPFMLSTLAPPQSLGSLQAQRQARFCSSVARWPL